MNPKSGATGMTNTDIILMSTAPSTIQNYFSTRPQPPSKTSNANLKSMYMLCTVFGLV